MARHHANLKSLLLLAATAVGGSASAQQTATEQTGDALEEEPVRRYGVEIILFTYGDSVSAGTEVFVPEEPPEPPVTDGFREYADLPPGEVSLSLPQADDPFAGGDGEPVPEFGDTLSPTANSGELETELEVLVGASSVNLRVLTPEELTLTAEHEKLLRLDAYQPVLWAGWEQDVRDETLSPPIKLRRLGNVPLSFSGQFKLYLGRFLHLITDIRMQAPSATPEYASYRARPPSAFGQQYGYAADGYPKAQPVFYEINDNRIMKSDELRYFDHPKFGVLARLTRIEEETLPAEDDFLAPTTDDLAPATPPAPPGGNPPR